MFMVVIRKNGFSKKNTVGDFIIGLFSIQTNTEVGGPHMTRSTAPTEVMDDEGWCFSLLNGTMNSRAGHLGREENEARVERMPKELRNKTQHILARVSIFPKPNQTSA